MSELTISDLGLILCLAPAIVHAVEVYRPLWARWVVNWVLPFFGPGLPRPSKALTHDDEIAMLDAALGGGACRQSPGWSRLHLRDTVRTTSGGAGLHLSRGWHLLRADAAIG